MQKIINGIAIFSGAVALGIVGLGGYVFIRKDAIIDNVKSKIMESVLPGGIGGALGGVGLWWCVRLTRLSRTSPTPDAPTSPNFAIRFLENLIF